jgi:hypothetical protein
MSSVFVKNSANCDFKKLESNLLEFLFAQKEGAFFCIKGAVRRKLM